MKDPKRLSIFSLEFTSWVFAKLFNGWFLGKDKGVMKLLMVFTMHLFLLTSVYSYELRLSLTDQQEVSSKNGIIEGGVFTSQGWKVTQSSDRLRIPIPSNLKSTSTGYFEVRVKYLPYTFPQWDCGDPNSKCPWGRELFGIGGMDNVWEYENSKAVLASYWIPCDGISWQGILRHKLIGDNGKTLFHSTPPSFVHWCDNPNGNSNEEVTFRYEWKPYQVVVYDQGRDCGQNGDSKSPGSFDIAGLWIHISTHTILGGGYGDITGAVFSDLTLFIDEDAPQLVCGDKKCEGAENCENCLADCGCKSPCYVCKAGECVCNSPHFECPSCLPSCGMAGQLNNTESICCESGCLGNLRRFDAYDCNYCCEGKTCSSVSIDGGVEDSLILTDGHPYDSIDTEDAESRDEGYTDDITYQKDVTADNYDRFDVLIEDGVCEFCIDEDGVVDIYKTDVKVLSDLNSEEEESSACSCSFIE